MADPLDDYGAGDPDPLTRYQPPRGGRRSYGKGSVQTDEPPPLSPSELRDQALWSLQEELNRRAIMDQGRGAVAGIANPFGLTGWGARGLSYVAPWMLSPDTARGFQGTLDRWDRNAPVAASLSTFMVPGAGLSRLLGMTGREVVGSLPHLGTMGMGIGNVRSAFMGDRDLTDEERGRDYGAAGYDDGGRVDPLTLYTPPPALQPPPDAPNRLRRPPHRLRDLIPLTEPPRAAAPPPDNSLSSRDEPGALWRWIGMNLTPFGSGHRLAQGISERDPLTAGLGAAGIALSMPGAWNYMAHTLPNRMLTRGLDDLLGRNVNRRFDNRSRYYYGLTE